MKKIANVLGLTALFLLITKKAQAPQKSLFNRPMKIRPCEPTGCGYYLAPRGDRKHYGIDVITTPGEVVIAPVDAYVNRTIDPYGDGVYSGLELIGVDGKLKVMYITPLDHLVGKSVKKGQVIGTAQDITKRYAGQMTPHIHVEYYKNEINSDPTKYLFT